MDEKDAEIKVLKEEIRSLKETRKTLRHNFQGMVQLLVETISLSNRFLGGHLKRTSEMVKSFRQKQKRSKDDIYLGFYSALLHDIGLVGENPLIIEKPIDELSPEEREKYFNHTIIGYEILNSIYNLKRIAAGVRSHHENYDGTGFPDKLAGKEIPEEARLIHIIDDYDHYRFKNGLSPEESVNRLLRNSGKLYDPRLLNEFEHFIEHYCINDNTSAKTVPLEKLEPGMYLDEDIINLNGALLVPQGVILDALTINKIKTFSERIRNGTNLRVIY